MLLDEQNREVAPVGEVDDHLLDLGDHVGLDALGRLVEDQEARLGQQRPGDGQLLALASRPGEVVTKRELLAEVWRDAYGGSERTVDVHLSWLRRKLGETAAVPRYLHSVRGVGVRLVDPGEQD